MTDVMQRLFLFVCLFLKFGFNINIKVIAKYEALRFGI